VGLARWWRAKWYDGRLAFGVEPGYPPFSLRQSRYHALAEDVASFVNARPRSSREPITLLDVGVFDGVSRRYIEVHPGTADVRFHGVDLFPHGKSIVYKQDSWSLGKIDFEDGLTSVESDRFDVVICEQVLEHLRDFKPLLRDIGRVLAPGGLLIVGVPIFPHGLHWVRKTIVPRLDRAFHIKKTRGHIQAFSQKTFLRAFHHHCGLEVLKIRGFRIASEGLLAPLEHLRVWWMVNRRIGDWIPSLCTEIQIVATKRCV
jgi:SAM-dependent methyltransferase